MYGNLILPIFISLIIFINGQSDDDRDLPQEVQQPVRHSKSSFDAQFRRGRCPDQFYQLGDECVYFATDGRRYSWRQAQRVCARRVARSVQRQTSFVGQPIVKPTNGVRQLMLNTPEKKKILEALYREYEEVNVAVRLPSDFRTLHRCNDGKDDHWPSFCTTQNNSNATCFETSELGSNNICLRQIDCVQRLSRLACEFTLPGSTALTGSQFRHCPKSRSLSQRVPVWTWLLVAFGAMLLLLLLLGGVLKFMYGSKSGTAEIRKSVPDTRRSTTEKVVTMPINREDSAGQPMLVRATPINTSTTDYLESQSTKRVVPSTTIPNIPVRKTSTTAANV